MSRQSKKPLYIMPQDMTEGLRNKYRENSLPIGGLCQLWESISDEQSFLLWVTHALNEDCPRYKSGDEDDDW